MSRKQRKKNFVDGHVQGALLRRILRHWLLFFGVLALTFLILQVLMADPSKPIYEIVSGEIGNLSFLGVIVLCLLPAFLLDTIKFSNRFTGPIARLRSQLRELADGKTDPCVFRGGDFWSEMASEFNEVANLVKAQQEEIASLKRETATSTDSKAVTS